MNLTLKRIAHNKGGTFGVLLNGDTPMCATLENEWKDNARNVSCIPTGTYMCYKYHSEKYPDVWALKDVPNRSAILIHAGNTHNDTRGCILVGERYGRISGESAVLRSGNALSLLRSALPDEFELTIEDCI